jgi:hypothetical protein
MCRDIGDDVAGHRRHQAETRGLRAFLEPDLAETIGDIRCGVEEPAQADTAGRVSEVSDVGERAIGGGTGSRRAPRMR